MRKSIAQFLPKLGLASYLCCLLLHLFLTNKRHPSDVEPSYLPISRLIQSAVYPVGVSKDCSCFTQMIDHNSKDLVRILTKIDTDNHLRTLYKCTELQLDWSTSLRVTAIFKVCEKTKKKKNEKNLQVCSLVSCKAIFFKFGEQSPLVGRHLHSNFGVLQTEDHGVMNA